ncbi:MAG TPA: tetratricopeptide repeat protein [Candidatus Sulfotelmatobacter sp.]|nr:tetratricopeptide repeat protein [Candidatus Sulfotelmatobacter sp.]
MILLFMGCTLALAQKPAATPASSGRHVPEAKSHQEFNDYNAAYALTGGAQVEKAANDFSVKYPASELKSYLYAKALHEYQNENNSDKMLAMGEKVLQLDPDNTIALVLTATVLADSLEEKDSNREQKIAEIRKHAAHALATMDSAFVAPVNATLEQITDYKKTLQSMAHSALGITALKTGEDTVAEQELKTAVELNVTQPDPYLWYHLALAQDHQNKVSDALASVNKAAQYMGQDSNLAKLVQGEQKRLQTHPEITDFNAAFALSGGAASEKAADDFAAKFPGSERKVLLYEKAMYEYEKENNKSKVLSLAGRVLQLNPDSPRALVFRASVLSDTLAENDLERNKKIDEIRSNSAHALRIIDTNFVPVADATAEDTAAYKKTVQALAHSALGITALKTGDNAGAEKELRIATEANPAKPDSYVWYHLALAQDRQEKYPEALVSINRALEYAGNSDLADTVRNERKRLLMKNGFTGPQETPNQIPGSPEVGQQQQTPAPKPPAPK